MSEVVKENADVDKMLSAREGIVTYIKTLSSSWINVNPLFFMALPDADLYETDTRKHICSLFKSTTGLQAFTTALLEFDEN